MRGWKRKAFFVLVVISLGAAGFLVWKWRIESKDNPDPRLTYSTTYRNVRPNVAYVGDERCAACHEDIATTYRQHPMGQSLGVLEETTSIERLDQSADNPFEALGFRYQVLRRGTNMIHQESRLDAKGKTLSTHQAEVQFYIGSGARGRSYVVGRDGFLSESPISWYSHKEKWDLSPGYRNHNRHFERPIRTDCLFCHANQIQPVKDTMNRFHLPDLKGQAIGCERCHGPGDLHVRRQENGEGGGAREDIVHPGHLAPMLRDAVCEQCHLQGEGRVPRRGRQLWEYRPGLPLHLFLAAFVRPAEFTDEFRAVGQVEQMTASRCYQQSAGKMGCISCHDPHRLPPADGKIAYYRDRCQACHEPATKDCLVPLPDREKKQNNCLACHMQRLQSSNIAHTAITDHRIVGRRAAPSKKPPRSFRPDDVPLVHFHGKFLEAGDDVERELGIALAQLARDLKRSEPARLALQRLEKSLQKWPGDPDALLAKGISLTMLKKTHDALETFVTLLADHPDREEGLVWAASLAQALGENDKAISYWQRAIAVSPYVSENHYALGYLHSQGKKWKEALLESRKALQINPARLDARKLLILGYLRLGDRKRAQEEFDVFQSFGPPDLADVKAWFENP